jgi:protein SCO1/2
LLTLPAAGLLAQSSPALDREEALRASQAAIGGRLSDLRFVDASNKSVRMRDFRGAPLVVNHIYTSCYHSCRVSTRYLGEIVDDDSPERMAIYARRQGIETPGWTFLSADAETTGAVVKELGFTYAESPKGYDHMAQVSIIDGDGRVYRQIYGDRFEPPALVEPLKELVWGLDTQSSALDRWADNIRLFCTIYDPSVGRYRFDYSIFAAIIIGFLCLTAIAVFVIRAWREGSSPLPH